MIEKFESIVAALTQPKTGKETFSVLDPGQIFNKDPKDDAAVAQALNAAFLLSLSGTTHPSSESAERYLVHLADSDRWAEVAQFYLAGLTLVHQEIEDICQQDAQFAARLKRLSEWLSDQENTKDARA
ncbi:MAG: hypothetical protein PVH02_17900, partial [Desulfobacteraceae bacterium]